MPWFVVKEIAYLFQVSANGGEAKVLTQAQDSLEAVRHCFPQILPGSKVLLFTRLPKHTNNPDDGAIEVLDLESGERQKVLEDASLPVRGDGANRGHQHKYG